DIVHVPYKGTGPSMIDLLGGQIDMVFSNLPPAVPYVQDGRMRGLAITTAAREANAFFHEEIAKWAQVIKASGAKAE
ncbi:MAG: tripartite tricarboxylate transporter substrate binding protein, partial [Betaproteobacteria bacterium]|nr:tripartite tricarboxylate transporter substrate binding protein [Betaproteobacteria bacterium]